MILDKIKREVRGTLSYLRPAFIRSSLRGDDAVLRRWYRKGCPPPAPPVIKQVIFKTYATHFHPPIFIETGTYRGDTTYFLKDDFEELYTIELSHELYVAAQARLGPFKQIKQLQGDSGKRLGEILAQVNRPCMFWLDGHYSGGETAKGDKNCPLLEELSHIWRHPVKDHIILLDDVRCFGTTPDYPSVAELAELGRKAGYDWEVNYDILFLTPKGKEKLGAKLKALIE